MYSRSIKELLDQVIELEKEGARFYRKLATQVRIEAIKKAFLEIADDEDQHQKQMMAILDTFKNADQQIESSLDLSGALTFAVNEIARILKGSEPVNIDEIDLHQAFKIAIHNEREAVRVYSQLSGIAQSKFAQIIDRIRLEEASHVEKLEKMKITHLG